MKRAKPTFFTKLLERLDRVGTSELQNYLRELARQKGFLETIFNTLQEGVLVIDPEGVIRYLNPSVERLLGIGEAALGKNIAHYIRDVDWKKSLAEAAVISRDLEVFYPQPRLLNFYVVPLEDRNLGFAVIFHDITASQERTRERIESEKLGAVMLLAAGVAHELGNPLNSLHIQFQLMERELREIGGEAGQRLRENIGVAQREVARLDNIIRQFLQALRPEPPQRSLESVNDVLQESVDFLRPELNDRDILVELELDGGLPLVEIDAGQIKQAFFNLIKNALQAMKPGGMLRIQTSRNDTHLLITFADNGSGISVETVSRIFDPYFTTKPKGSGLGLFIVRRIIRAHGGELMLESEAGRGTTAKILLPLIERRVRMLEYGDRDTG